MKRQTYTTLFFLIAIIITSCNTNTEKEDVQTAPAKKRTIVSSVIATGIVKPQTGSEVKVGSRISGIVDKLYVNVGDTVKKGDLLAKLEEMELLAEYNQALANLENTTTVLKYAQIEQDRQKELYSKNFTSRQNYDNAVKDYELAITRQKQAQANVDYAKVQLDYTNIIAPTNGVVASIATQEGETVAAMFAAPTFVTIIDLDRLEVRAYVDETDISAISNGQKVQFSVDTYADVKFQGLVKTIYPKAEVIDNVVNYITIIEITNNFGKLLRPEMTTTVDIITDSIPNALTVPNKAITKDNGANVVYIYDGSEMIKKKVSLGKRGKLYTQIKSGIRENDKVVLNSFNVLNN
ncbi:MAG: efflux RND transporter periplasmic adaptor subunit [Marinilabiliales bacterium]|nr:MAG: efflux RND transporter periplasmic adaptor subunit [Marinilabiliales bacterium]